MAATVAMPADLVSGGQSPITDFFRNRSIFLTGATGFMGKVLAEKLLRSCSDLRAIYILVRPKRGHDVEERRQQLLSIKIFDQLRAERPQIFNKLIAMEGDITKPNLGLSAADQETLTNHVSVVFHSAATVRFDEPLRNAVSMNIEGTARLVELCKGMRNLVAFVHVSTAYSNCDRKDIDDKFYDPPYDPEQFCNVVKVLDDATLHAITPKLLGKRPNTYTLTKALAENLLCKIAKDLPVTIIRPSIVTGSHKEPFPGWVDNLNGPAGLLAGAAKGIVRTLLCHADVKSDIVPVDLSINLMLAAAWHIANTSKPPLPKIYQIVSGAQKPVTWGDLQTVGFDTFIERPWSGIAWYPGGSYKRNKFYNQVCVAFQHDIPAFLVDLGLRLMRKKPFLVSLHKRLHRMADSLEFFTTNEWNFSDKNVRELLKELTPEDLHTYNFDIRMVNWTDYIRSYCEGIRVYVMKEGPEIEEKSIIRMRRMHMVHRTLEILFILMCLRFIFPKRLKSAARLLIAMLLFATKGATTITTALLLTLSKAFSAV